MADAKTADLSAIVAWLGLPPGPWPPDHYTLLGLPRGETDLLRIERQAQQRMETVRRYQLTNPEMATEALNRLARAFVCLTDPKSKSGYDRDLFRDERPSRPAPSPTPRPQPPSRRETPPVSSLPTVLETSPPPPLPPPAAPPVPAVQSEDPELLSMVADEMRRVEQAARARVAEAAARATVPPPDDEPHPSAVNNLPTVVPAAPESPTVEVNREARRGLTSVRSLIRRVARTRKVLYAWDATGDYLNRPERRLSKPDETKELHQSMADLRAALEGFPSLVGAAGQPGYLVLSLARQPLVGRTFQDLLPGQREALARDWNAGREALTVYKEVLRNELAALRRKSAVGKLIRATRLYLRDHPSVWLAGVGVLALLIALWRSLG